MKLTDTYESPVVSTTESATFGMQSSGKMFKMVISGLYSNKAQSITREIWSNAFDAHAMCGKENTPFDVNLPSRFKSEFVVRDYGEGLSHEWMLKKYTIVGFSAKEDTNLAVGKWGVGRMSPLSYIDTFTVTSIHKGKKAVYNVTMAADGAPTLNVLVPPMDTNEPSGLRVSFPVQPSDVGLFNDAANRVSLGFDVKPTVNGEPKAWPLFGITVEGKGYKTFKSSNIHGVVAQMGCVVYPVDMSQLGLDYSDQRLFQFMNLLIEAPIGSVEVTASREDLSYGAKEPTKEFLKGKLMEIKKALVEDTQKELDKCTNSYQAFKVYRDCGLPHQLLKALRWNGKPIDNDYEPLEPVTFVYRKSSAKLGSDYVATRTSREPDAIIVGYKNGPTKDLRVETRLRNYVLGESGKRFIRCVQTWDTTDKEYKGQDFKALEKFYGCPVVYVKDMTDTGPTKRGSTAKVYDFCWNNITVDMEDGGVYVKAENGCIVGLNWSNTVRGLKCAGDGQQVIANKSLWKKFDGHPEWKDITQDILKEIKDRHKEFSGYCEASTYGLNELGLQKWRNELGGILKSYYETYDKIKGRKIEVTGAGNLLAVANLPTVETDEYKLLKHLERRFRDTYPMFKLISGYELRNNIGLFKDYVKLIDESKGVS